MATLSEPIAAAGTTTPDEWFEGTRAATGPADTGATTLTVVDAADFAEDGGQLKIGADVYPYSTVDDETGVITLTTPLTATYAEGDRVLLHPLSQEKYAQVMVGDFDEAQQARVPHDLWEKIGEGIRPDGQGEVVELALDQSEFVVSDVFASYPRIDNPGVRSYRTSPQTIPHSATTQVQFDQTDYDTNGFNTDGGWTFVIPEGEEGLYEILCILVYADSSAGRRNILITLNDPTLPSSSAPSTIAGDNRTAAPVAPTTTSTVSRRRLEVGDALRVWTLQNSGANLDLVTNFTGCEFVLTRIAIS